MQNMYKISYRTCKVYIYVRRASINFTCLIYIYYVNTSTMHHNILSINLVLTVQTTFSKYKVHKHSTHDVRAYMYYTFIHVVAHYCS